MPSKKPEKSKPVVSPDSTIEVEASAAIETVIAQEAPPIAAAVALIAQEAPPLVEEPLIPANIQTDVSSAKKVEVVGSTTLVDW